MATKKLFVLISNDADGSYSTHFTFNEQFIKDLQAKYDSGELEHGDIGVDGDGFHYRTLTVPEECTLQSLNILYDAAED